MSQLQHPQKRHVTQFSFFPSSRLFSWVFLQFSTSLLTSPGLSVMDAHSYSVQEALSTRL